MRATLLSFLLCLGTAAAADEAFIGARSIDGTGRPVMEKATLLIRNGKVEAVGPSVKVPAGVQQIDAAGKTIVPGLINAHGHVGELSQLDRYARFGVTTVLSLGGEKEIEMRDQTRPAQQTAALARSRLFIAGPIPTSKTAEDGRKAVDALAAAKVDIGKIRIDDQLGAAAAMSPEVYTAIIEEAHKKGLRMAVHIVKLADAKAVLRLGTEVIAHSVRDAELDDETIALFKKAGAFYIPTFTRELSTFVYGDQPTFLKDPFLLKDVNQAELAQAQNPQFQASQRNSKSAQWYKEHLDVAMRNMKKLLSAGVPVAMGTDTGPPQRFQGYFEHLELEYMVKAGMTPMQALVSATGTAAKCLKTADQFGTLEKGKWADLIVLTANPLEDIRNTRKVESVWIAGNLVK
jgi:imidazolonepropionase-like amidohydrolase